MTERNQRNQLNYQTLDMSDKERADEISKLTEAMNNVLGQDQGDALDYLPTKYGTSAPEKNNVPLTLDEKRISLKGLGFNLSKILRARRANKDAATLEEEASVENNEGESR